MTDTKYKWCEPNIIIKNIKTGIDQVLRSSYLQKVHEMDGCLRWVCQCRHDQGAHNHRGVCCRCSCKKFEYLNNNNCDLECSIQRKIYESSLV